MRVTLLLMLAFGFHLSAQAEIAVTMKAPGSIPESQLYMLSGVESETTEKVAQHLVEKLEVISSAKDKTPALEKVDLKTALATAGLPITQLNKIEYFSNKNQSQIFKVTIKDHQYQIYVSASKDLALVVGS